jgi:ubiquinone/menaquinone biosynthesis C-methylase UbiE
MSLNSDLKENQYNDSGKFSDRINLYAKFSTNKYPWPLWIFDNIEKPNNARVLELGCGTGLLWKANMKRIPEDWEITLSDFSEGMLRDAEENLNGLFRNINFKVIDAENIDYPDTTFDIVIANHMLYHVPDISKAIAEISRVLKVTGKFYSTTMGYADMKEIRELITEFNPNSKHRISTNTLRNKFSLENGGIQLSKCFNHVQLLRREDSLEITESEPLVKYYLSCNGIESDSISLNEDEADRLGKFIDSKLMEQKKLYVTKELGMFICSGKIEKYSVTI